MSVFIICSDKRTDSWPLVYSPVPISCIFLCYLLLVWLGPKMMAGRQPVNLRPVLIVYNFAMVGLSAYMFYEVLFARPCSPLSFTVSSVLSPLLQSVVCSCSMIKQPALYPKWYKIQSRYILYTLTFFSTLSKNGLSPWTVRKFVAVV